MSVNKRYDNSNSATLKRLQSAEAWQAWEGPCVLAGDSGPKMEQIFNLKLSPAVVLCNRGQKIISSRGGGWRF